MAACAECRHVGGEHASTCNRQSRIKAARPRAILRYCKRCPKPHVWDTFTGATVKRPRGVYVVEGKCARHDSEVARVRSYQAMLDNL